MTQESPRIFTVKHMNPKLFTAAHSNTRLFALTHLNARIFALTHLNPRLFACNEIWTPCETEVQALAFGAVNYAPDSEIPFNIYFWNTGGKGNDDITWQLIDEEEIVLASGSVNTGTVKWRASGSVSDIVTAPADYKEIRVRAKGGNDVEWVYSAVAYVLPVDLAVTAVLPDGDIFLPETPVTCDVLLTNAGFSGSQTIEWQMINAADQSVIDSGTQSSGIVGDFANTEVELNDILSPVGDNILFTIRARILGSSTWIVSMLCGNYLSWSPPDNPDPRL